MLVRLDLAPFAACALAVAFGVLFLAAKHVPPLAGACAFCEDPFDAVGSFGVQLAAFAAVVAALVSALALRALPPAPGLRARSLVAGVLALVVLALYPAGWRQGVLGVVLTALAGTAAFFVLVRALAAALLTPPEAGAPDLLDDLTACARALRARGRTLVRSGDEPGDARRRAGEAAAGARRHAWKIALAAGMAAGLGLALAEAFGEGSHTLPRRFALVVAVFVGFEGAGVLLGYALLGRLLALVRDRA